ncbi:MAG: phosphotransferase [Erysipelothrix sp.]
MKQALFDLLRIKAMNPQLKSQRDFKNKTNFSLGKINSLINEAVEEKYMSFPDYSLTEHAYDFLNQYKVDNAIILAAGINSQDTYINYRYPKGMYEINEIPLIERQIMQLKKVGITSITVVVGYAKESFEYLVDKHQVELVYNENFSHGNNILSLRCVASKLKNSYILDSDIFMSDNLFSTFEYNSWCATVASINATNAWVVNVGTHDRVDNIQYGGENGLIMKGPVFVNEAFSKQLIIDMNKDLIAKSSRYLFWEEIFINRTKEYELYARYYNENQIIEFESLEDVQKFDTTYLNNLDKEIKELISGSLDINLASISEINVLKRGVTNETYSFLIDEEKFCIRLPRRRSETLVSYSKENAIYEAMGISKMNDSVIFLDQDKGYKISKFVGASSDKPLTDDEKITSLKNAHDRNIKVEYNFDIMGGIKNLRRLCVRRDAIMYRDYRQVNKNIVSIHNKLKIMDRPITLCHGDPVEGNFIRNLSGNIVIIDWEYAGMADPFLDVAMFAVYEKREESEVDEILNVYLGRKAVDSERAVYYSYVALCGFFWALWSQYEQSLGENFGMYSIYQYQYARNYSGKALEALNMVK